MFTPNHNYKNEILFLTTYPPKACGIATYSKDLVHTLQKQFSSFTIQICALDDEKSEINYPPEVKYVLNSSNCQAYLELAREINENDAIKMVFIQHEFGLFGGDYGAHLLSFLYELNKEVALTFHTVLPQPDTARKEVVQLITNCCDEVVVMNNYSAKILERDYDVPKEKMTLISHGAHLIPWKCKQQLRIDGKISYHQFQNRQILSTFGLLSPNKGIETTLDALPKIVDQFPNVLFLVLGKTHPGVIRHEGEAYREFLKEKVKKLKLENNVQFVNRYLSLPELLNYLCLTTIYLFTSKDPYQAVSGTLAYAMSSKCAVISTPIPHALESLQNNAGVIIDFDEPEQLANATIRLLSDEKMRVEMGRNAFHQTRNSIWENSAIQHAKVFHRYLGKENSFSFCLPEIKLDHINNLTNETGIIQFSDICTPDINSGYTLDDNARALISLIMHYEQTEQTKDLELIQTYLNFIDYCQQPDGRFLNYLDKNKKFHIQNHYTNLEDSNGRAIWALGYLMNHKELLAESMLIQAERILRKFLPGLHHIESPRAIGFVIKGLYFYNKSKTSNYLKNKIDVLADKLLEKYHITSDLDWNWFEEYLTYANSILPEALLCAYLVTNKPSYRSIAHVSFEFLLSQLFKGGTIKVISNRGWLQKGSTPNEHGEQPIDVSYIIQALEIFYEVFKDETYREKMEIAFSWFLGNNHLNQILYNPLNGGCYDGLEKESVNLNQGAESAVCFLMARLTIEKLINPIQRIPLQSLSADHKTDYLLKRTIPKPQPKQSRNPIELS